MARKAVEQFREQKNREREMWIRAGWCRNCGSTTERKVDHSRGWYYVCGSCGEYKKSGGHIRH